MTEEEKRAVENLEEEVYSIEGLEIQEITFYSKGIEDIKIVLNLIQKLQEGNNNKDKIIDDLIKQQQEREKSTSSLEEKLSLIETYYDISDLDRIVKEDV